MKTGIALKIWMILMLCIFSFSLIAQEPAQPESDPKKDSDNFRFENALQLYNLKRYDKALPLFGEYIEVFTEGAHRKEAFRYIGDIYLSRFDYPHALKYYSLLYEEFSSDEEGIGGYFQMGICYSRMGNGDKAIAIYKNLIDQYPASRYAQKAKAQLDLEELIKK
jgi:TolA-binding protein